MKLQFLPLQLLEMQQNLLELENLYICLKSLNPILVYVGMLNICISDIQI